MIKFAHYFETLTKSQNTKPFHRLVSWLVSNNAQCLDTVVIQTIITRERLRDTVRFIFRAEKCIFAMAINLMGYRAGRQTSCVSSEIKALIGWMANIRIVFLFWWDVATLFSLFRRWDFEILCNLYENVPREISIGVSFRHFL